MPEVVTIVEDVNNPFAKGKDGKPKVAANETLEVHMPWLSRRPTHLVMQASFVC